MEKIGLLIVAFLLIAFHKPFKDWVQSSRENNKTRKEQQRLFGEAFERFVTDMEAYWNDRMAISDELCLRRVRNFHSALSEAWSGKHIKKSVHDIALETIKEATEVCKQRKIDVDYLKGQYEKAMKKKWGEP